MPLSTLRTTRPPAELPNVKAMQGEWHGCWRMRVGSLRIIFRIVLQHDAAEAMEILQIGPRGDVYK
jgi:mRNA-degrading endonuclease RelE of RelBE toxin-antitoxin system